MNNLKILTIGWYRPAKGFWIIFNSKPIIAFDWTEKFSIRFFLKTRVYPRH